MTKKQTALALLFALAVSPTVFAQDATTTELPAICRSGMQHEMGGMTSDSMAMDQAHEDMARGMDEMNAQMMQGMQASDIDVAFICGMIPHHQGAINMARAELAHGDNDWAKMMAQKVIEAQEAEIADMLTWLSEQK
jgi:uncharacterized protein (DUF305 family)